MIVGLHTGITGGGLTPFARYAAGGINPTQVADFKSGLYLPGPTFSDKFTFARDDNATMVDSDGVLKWAPHNIAVRSQEFDSASWTKDGGLTVTANNATDPDGGSTADTLNMSAQYHGVRQNFTLISGVQYTLKVWARRDSGSNALTFWNQSGAASLGSYSPTSTWAAYSVDFTASGTMDIFFSQDRNASGQTAVEIWGAHLYRSDLGGMVDNPETGDSYVPTTSAAVYLPRIGHHVYDGSSWVNKGLLLESEARTNLITYSEDFSSDWTTTDATIPAADGIAPDGTLSAIKLTEAATTAFHFTSFAVVLGAAAHSFSVYMKAAERTTASLFLSQGGNVGALLDLSAGTVSSVSGTGNTATIQDVGNGWYRCTVTNDGSADLNDTVRIGIQDGALASYLGDGSSGVYIWGAQLEEGSAPSSYIPTNGSTVIRPAETLDLANTPSYGGGEVTGSELVTNGTFDTDTSGWSPNNSTLSVVSGKLRQTQAGAGLGFAQTSITTVIGQTYKFQWEFTEGTGGTPTARVSSTTLGADIASVNADVGEVVFTAATTTTYINFRSSTTTDGTYSDFDNISVKPCNPEAISFVMHGEVNYADTGVTVEGEMLRWDAGTAEIVTYFGTSGADTGELHFRQVDGAGTIDEVISASNALSPSLNVPFKIASYHKTNGINGAVNGTVLTENTTPVTLPDLSGASVEVGYDFMGTISQFSVFEADIGDTGLGEATS